MARTRARARYEIGVVDKTSGKLDDIQRNFSSFNDSILRVGGAFAGLAGAAGIGALINQVTAAGVEIHDLNKTMGAGVEALSQYRHVASQSNVDFNTFTTSLSKMQIRISEAAKGGGEAVKVLSELGLNVDKLATLAPEDQFEVIAQAFGHISDSGDRARIATKLFEESGVSLLKIVDQDIDGIKRLREEADQLGLTFSKENVEAMAEFDSKLNMVKNSVIGMSQSIVLQLGEPLAELANSLAQDIPDAANFFLRTISAIKQSVLEVRKEFWAADVALLGFFATFAGGDRLKNIREAQRRELGYITDIELQIADVMQEQVAVLERQEKSVFKSAAAFDSVYNPALKTTAAATGTATEKTKELAEELDVMGLAMDAIDAQFKERDRKLAQSFAGLTPAIKEANAETEKMDDTARTLGLTFASSFEDAIIQAKGFREILNSLIDDIAKIIIRKSVTEPIANFIGNALSSGISGAYAGTEPAGATARGAPGVTVNINGPVSDAGLVPIVREAASQGARMGYAMVQKDIQGGGPIRGMLK